MTKIITDLKKFGSKAGKTVRIEQIKQGYGDQVCHIIDELLNIELYRKQFQFHQPIIPPDEEEEGDDEPEDDAHDDSIILINGGKIEAREIRNSPDANAKK